MSQRGRSTDGTDARVGLDASAPGTRELLDALVAATQEPTELPAPEAVAEVWRRAKVAGDALLAVVERLTFERDALGRAVVDAAVKAGVCRGDVTGLVGPQLIALADDVAALAAARSKEVDPTGAAPVADVDLRALVAATQEPVGLLASGVVDELRRRAKVAGEAILAALEAATTRADRAQYKADEAFREVAAGLEREHAMRRDLSVVATDVGGVWRWQGDGHDDPESLTCPVVMSAATLRSFVEDRATLANLMRLVSTMDDLEVPYEGADFEIHPGASLQVAESVDSYAIDEDAPLMKKAAAMIRVLGALRATVAASTSSTRVTANVYRPRPAVGQTWTAGRELLGTIEAVVSDHPDARVDFTNGQTSYVSTLLDPKRYYACVRGAGEPGDPAVAQPGPATSPARPRPDPSAEVDLWDDLTVVRYEVAGGAATPCSVRTGSGYVRFDLGPWRVLEAYGDDFPPEAYALLFGEAAGDDHGAHTIAVHAGDGTVAWVLFGWADRGATLAARVTPLPHPDGAVVVPRHALAHLDGLGPKRPYRLTVRAATPDEDLAQDVTSGLWTRETLFAELVVHLRWGGGGDPDGERLEVSGRSWRKTDVWSSPWPATAAGGDVPEAGPRPPCATCWCSTCRCGDLLPCPFCGDGAVRILPQEGGLRSVDCQTCGATKRVVAEHDEGVVAAWNRRPVDPVGVRIGASLWEADAAAAIDHYREGLHVVLRGAADPIDVAASYLGEAVPGAAPTSPTRGDPTRGADDHTREDREPFAARYWAILDVEGLDPEPLALFTSKVMAEAECARRAALPEGDDDRLSAYHQVFPADVVGALWNSSDPDPRGDAPLTPDEILGVFDGEPLTTTRIAAT